MLKHALALLLIICMALVCSLADVQGQEITCYKTGPDTTICKDNKGKIVKTVVEGRDGTLTVTTKDGTKRCFTTNGMVICR